MNAPKISVLVPVYKVEKYIDKCARSLFEQTYENIEYIFVDDASPDKSIDLLESIIEEYPKRKNLVKILRHETNRGLSSARNTALDHASGDYIYIVDSDDYIDQDTLSKLMETSVSTNADIVISDFTEIYNSYKRVKRINILENKMQYLQAVLMRKTNFTVWGKLMRANLFDNIRFIGDVTYAEDYGTYPRLLYYASNVVKVDIPLYNYVKYNQAACTAFMTEKNINDALCVANMIEMFFSNVPDHEKFQETVKMSLLKFKVHLIQSCYSSIPLVDKIVSYWKIDDKDVVSKLSLKDRCLLAFSNRRNWMLLIPFLYLNNRIFKLKRLF